MRRWGVLCLMLCGGVLGCGRNAQSAAPKPLLPYPACEGKSALHGGTELAGGTLRAGPWMRNRDVVERFVLYDRGCVYVMRVHQAWPLGISDVDAVFDRDYRPLRVWMRTMMPSRDGRRVAAQDTRLVEMRRLPVRFERRGRSDRRRARVLAQTRPIAAIGPGRTLLTAWLRAAQLAPGNKERGPVLDLRGAPVVRPTTLVRRPDRWVRPLRRRLRVYTFLGRETIYADDNDTVVADLAGLWPASKVSAPMPPALPTGSALHPERL
ncbi:MAG: hypothetical protein ACPGUV_02435 [Polyangiales bacterium]